jgi:uncharacterized membrane protein YfcA
LPDIYAALILFVTGSLAGFINVMAGGGSSITLPVLIFLGLDSATANGTNRIGVLFQNVSAVYAFKREKYNHFKTSFKLALWTLPGSILGAIIAIDIEDALFNKILGIIMIGIIFTILFPIKKRKYEDHPGNEIHWGGYLSMFFAGFYGGFIQVGIGFLLMAALEYSMKINLIYVNMHKVFIVMINMVPALLIFALSGHVNWKLGLMLALGYAFGGWFAAKYSITKGEKLIRIVLIIAILIMSGKLLDIF